MDPASLPLLEHATPLQLPVKRSAAVSALLPNVFRFNRGEMLSSVTVNEVEALYELYKKLSFSIIKYGLIHKEEFQLALFTNNKGANLFADRVFDLFDLKRNGVIGFGEFVRLISVFHPKTPESEKTAFAFKLYDLRGTGYIEKEELRELFLELLDELDLHLWDNTVETIVDNTFNQADSNGDGKIDPKEWEELSRTQHH